jgi:tetratricopeptide (TPR) repeat protein
MKKYSQYIIWGVVGLVAVLALVWYYQQQGLIKVFPTSEERALRKILVIDESTFRRPEGLTEDQYNRQVEEIRQAKKDIEENPENADAWFRFGFVKSFFNDHQGAMEAFETSYELQPNFRTALNLGETYQYFIKDWEKAEKYYLAVLVTQPDNTSAYQGLMDLYRYNWKEKSNEYEPLVLRAADNDKINEVKYYGNLVDFFMSSDYKNEVKAKEYFELVKDLSPDLADALREDHPTLK